MPAHRTGLLACASALAIGVAIAGCGGGGQDGTAQAQGSPAPGGGGLPQGSEPVKLDPANFTTSIDNRFFPMAPGTRWVYRATTPGGKPERDVVTVTSDIKVIAGVKTRVLRDVTTAANGRKVEDTRDWYAQDRDGNVWYFGEATTAYKNGKPSSTGGSWEAGVKGAQAGIAMPANPTPGLSYRQEYRKNVAEDAGAILHTGERAETPLDRYKGVLVTRDSTALDRYDVEYKFYAPGVGPVLALGVAGDPDREELVAFHRGH